MKRFWLILLVGIAALQAPLHAQDRAGSTGAQVLQFLPGSRAAALSGAYTAVAGDADALFYNPAGIADLRRAGSIAYESYVSDVAFGSLGAATRLGALTVGASVAFLNAGEIDEVIADPDFGGNTGTASGNRVGASESALRLIAALPLYGGRLRAGAALGLVATSVADQQQHAFMADAGLQYDVGNALAVGVSLRNMGTALTGDARDELPSEARLGASAQLLRGDGTVFNGSLELISRLNEGSFGFAAGIEAGLLATPARPVALLARLGFDAESHQLGALRAGASIGLRDISFDYTYQNLEFFGAVHRFGLRLSRPR